MPWPLRLVELEDGLVKGTGKRPKPGDCWYAPWMVRNGKPVSSLSPEYLEDWFGIRPPLVICCPGGWHWVVDSVAENMYGHGWKVTGIFPNITARPSVVASSGGRYHGWLNDGVLTDDLDGSPYEC